jgi:hypothetical protein
MDPLAVPAYTLAETTHALLEEFNMFDRMRNGWLLATESIRILKSDKKLLVFPLLSFLACLAVLASFILPLINSPWARAIVDDQNQPQAAQDPLVYVILFAFYFANYFVIIFFNSALVACTLIRFNGGAPTIGDGLRAAASRLPQILGWALVSATVGMILKLIEDRSEKVGQFVVALLGSAWSALTFFVVPVLVVEKAGPVEAFKRSLALVKRTWGEAVTAHFSIGLIVFLFFLVALVPALIGIALGGPVLWLGLATSLVLLIVVALVSAAVNVIITAVLYQYAAGKELPPEMDARLLQGAFGSK